MKLERYCLPPLLWACRAYSLVNEDGAGRLPALGWSTWNAYECDIDATKILTAARAVVDLGLADLGYEYINIDDCWSVKTHRDPDTQRIIPDPDKFPNGIAGLVDEIHEMGLKVGIYSSAGETTCAGYPASLGYEQIDAETFAEWGIDYLKYDACGVPPALADPYTACLPDPVYSPGPLPNGTCPNLSNAPPQGYNWTASPSAEHYRAMLHALQSTTRPTLFSICNWGFAEVNTWGNATGNSWRMSGDISPGRGGDGVRAEWARIAEIANMNSFLMNYVDFWGRPDPDMLEVGNGNLTLAENRAHFALWAVMKGPLLIGTDLSQISAAHLAILSNPYLLAFHQDPVIGRPAYPYKWGYSADWTFDPAHPAEYWSGPSSTLHGAVVLLLNSENETRTRTAVWSEVPELRDLPGQVEAEQWTLRKKDGGRSGSGREGAFWVLDVWTGEELGCVQRGLSVELEAHDAAVLLVGPECNPSDESST
ncbi:glycoside hydrolase superfamily [Aspergillus pseudoustus]|uniref:Alpha-galactosidase n=1 Tax=Aspergillus pseudoustus TaxID=1810923 RepID=A0ABR4J457_9EURO